MLTVLLLLPVLGCLLPLVDSSPARNAYIYNGTDAVKGAQPYMVSFQNIEDGEPKHKCGGSLLTPNKVLTAAHCLWNHGKVPFQVALGAYKLSEAAGDPEVQVIGVKDVSIHEDYDINKHYQYDIAIITLEKDAKLTSTVKLVELSPKTPPELKGESFTFTGWGLNASHYVSDVMQYAEFDYREPSVCQENVLGARMDTYHLCVQNGEGVLDSCTGDSGGPLMLKGKQVGILSQGHLNCNEAYPSIYVNPASLGEWIASHKADPR